ncbi:MAG: PEP-CTERM sorting domain-containing protein [Planctomycetia bacterium]|nr:PEP-CTERM sorting domain-containing protein [Planctomycetia bacterium]
MILPTPVSGNQIYNGDISLADGGSIVFTQGNDSTFNSFTGNLTMTGGTFTINQKRALVAASSGTTTWDISGGTFAYTHSDGTKNGTFRFGTAWKNNTPTWTGDYTATLNLSNNASFSADRFILGFSDYGVADKTLTANMNMSGSASVTLGASAGGEYSHIGSGLGVVATLTMTEDSTLTASGRLLVGSRAGKGNLNMNGNSKLTSTNQLTIGDEASSLGTVTLSDNAQLTVSQIRMGSGSTENNVLNVNGNATLTVSGAVILGDGGLTSATPPASMNGNGTLNIGGGTATLGSLTIGYGVSKLVGEDTYIGKGTGSVNLTSGSLTVNGTVMVGTGDLSTSIYTGTGTLTQSGGTLTIAGDAGIRKGSTVTLSGGTKSEWKKTTNVWAGGTLNVTGGSGITFNTLAVHPEGMVNFSNATVVINSGSWAGNVVLNSGTVTMKNDFGIASSNTETMAVTTVKGGTFNCAQIQVGFAENTHGKLVVEGGNVIATYLQTGRYNNAVGYIEISGGELETKQGVRIARNTEGYLTMSGGKLKVGTDGSSENALILGYEGTGSYGQLDMTGGTIEVTTNSGTSNASILIGSAGQGVANIGQAEGSTTLVQTNTFILGNNKGANGTMNLTGGTVTGKNMYVGYKGTGTATISAGTVHFTNDLYTGREGTGTLNIEGGDVSGAYFCIGYADGASGTVNVTGGTLNVMENLRVGLNGTGTMTVSGGATSITTKNLYLPDNGSSLTFVMDDNQFTPITVTGTTELYGTLTADFGGGLQFTKDESLTLIKSTSSTASGLTDSDYFTVSKSGSNIVATVRTDLLPDDRSNRGVAEISADNVFTFYTGLWEDPDLLDLFVTWLNDANKNLNAQAVDLGGVLVQVPTNSFYALWDFSEFNTATGANVVFSQTPIVPEPASWMLLLLGLCVLRRKRR